MRRSRAASATGSAPRDVAVVDEVVLGDGEALPRALGRAVDAALQVEEDRALARGRARSCTRSGARSRVALAVGRDVAEAAAHLAGGEVADRVVRLARSSSARSSASS